jgi:hypothetical protein
MSVYRFYIPVLVVFTIAFSGCKQKSEKDQSVTPDLVTNPVSASGKQAKSDLPVLEFEQVKHEFGLIVQGEQLSYTFKFKNVGGSNAVISQVSSTCGCTIADWTKHPIKPGESGQVDVIFNSSGKPAGYISKTVNVLANTQPNTIQLEVTAEIYIPENKK